MSSTQYVIKISSQGQITLPKKLREQLRVRPGSPVTVQASEDNKLQVSAKLPIEKYFGTMGRGITGGKDAAEFVREMRNDNQRHRDKLLGQ
ncbi:MAG: AbrB/MazE/SpoVT family DNA-binding domain-containing protein [Patescibacteria group bacterium]